MAIKTARQVSKELLEQSEAAQANPNDIFGIANFGPKWPRLNWRSRGLQEKTFTVLAARQKVGKSTLVSQFLPEWGLQAKEVGKVVRVVTLETTTKTYQMRTAANLAGIKDPLRIRAGRLDDTELHDYRQSIKTISRLPIEYLSNEVDLSEEEAMIGGFSSIGMSQIEKFIMQPDTFLWVIDHAGLINRQNQGKNTTEQLETIANNLNNIAIRYVGGIVITHLNRLHLDGGMPSFENLAGTDVWGRNAGALYLLWRPFFESRNRTPEDAEMMRAMGGDPGLIVFKSRSEGNGSVGIFWNDETASFEESDKDEENMPRPGQGQRRQNTRRNQPHEDRPDQRAS